MGMIHYIGHGRLESAPENFSVLHVISHELGHVQEFRNDAFRSGEDIAEIRVRIDLEMKENGKIVAVSGETEAITKKLPEDQPENSLYTPYDKNKYSKIKNPLRETGSPEDSENPGDLNKKTIKETAEEFQRISRREYLEGKIRQIEAELQAREEKSSLEFQPTYFNQDPKARELEREKRKLEEEMRILQMEEETKKNFQFLEKANQKFYQNALDLTLPDKPSENQLLDISI